MNILFVGDIIGNPGCEYIKNNLRKIKKQYNIDMCIANGENTAQNGKGLIPSCGRELFMCGVDVITTGNHFNSKKEISSLFDDNQPVIRPLNYKKNYDGKGSLVFDMGRYSVGVVNLIGKAFINDDIINPFEIIDDEIEHIKKYTNIIIVDFHAEATSEKCCMGYYLDGKVSAVLGTHTHVQTADEKILEHGTAYITDVGMTGPYNSVLGSDAKLSVSRFTSDNSVKLEVAGGRVMFNGAVIQVDERSGLARSITRLNII